VVELLKTVKNQLYGKLSRDMRNGYLFITTSKDSGYVLGYTCKAVKKLLFERYNGGPIN